MNRTGTPTPAVAYQPALAVTAAALTAVSLDQANALLTAWGHHLGGCRRPFGAEGWVLEIAGRPVAVTVSASIASTTVAGLSRFEVVELARLCSAPDAAWATRPMLRLWREVAAPTWRYWPIRAAIAYSHNTRHTGDIYRFDGWTRISDHAGTSTGGGTWTRPRTKSDPARGAKTLWIWRYPPTEASP